jgi:hypothetical protein
MGAIANHGLDLLRRPLLERRIAVAFAKKIPFPGESSIKLLVQSLRITGIWVCADANLDIFTQCPCFSDLARGLSKDALKVLLTRKLDELSESIREINYP